MGVVEQSILAPGCVVSGGHIRSSVLGPRVEVHNGSSLDECVVMGGATIGKYCSLRRAIVEESTQIPDGAIVGHDMEADRRRFKVSERGVIVIPRRAPL
jgi:glucose-1-phosphate adenylyltransferase